MCRRVAETFLPALRAFGVPLDRMVSLRSTALSDRLRLFRRIVVVLTRSLGLVRGVRVVLAPVVFLSGVFGHLVLADSNMTRPQKSPWTVTFVRE
jgi:hypothetical protein